MTVTFDADVLLLQELEDELDKPRPCEARTAGSCGREATHWLICPACHDHKPWCMECVNILMAQGPLSADGKFRDTRCGTRIDPAAIKVEPIQ